MRKLWTRRKGVSTMIGGIIILTLFLSALSVMVFISQQYDKYQSTVENVNRSDVDTVSENLVGVYPGIVGGVNTTTGLMCPVPTGCSLLVSNEAGIGTEITRIYINSTYPNETIAGCAYLCVFDEASVPTSFHFLQSSAFLNPAESSHQVTLYTNSTLALPIGLPGLNSITLVTTRGRMFSFQYPFPSGGAVSYLTTNIMKIAYTKMATGGYDSSKEQAAGGTGGPGYCHSNTESATKIIAPNPYGTLWFVNPWISSTIFKNAFPISSGQYNTPVGYNETMLYVYVNVTNSQNQPIVISGGNIWLQVTYFTLVASQPTPQILVMGGTLIGTYYNNAWSTSPSVSPSTTVTLIYKINSWNWVLTPGPPSTYNPTLPPVDVTFSGVASMTSKNANGYFGGATAVDGLYVSGAC